MFTAKRKLKYSLLGLYCNSNSQKLGKMSTNKINVTFLNKVQLNFFRYENHIFVKQLGAIQKPRGQQGVGRWSKICHFCPRLLHKNVHEGRWVVKKEQNCVHVVIECPLRKKDKDKFPKLPFSVCTSHLYLAFQQCVIPRVKMGRSKRIQFSD